MTNRDFHLSIWQLIEDREKNRRTLEEYLLALWFLAGKHRHKTAIATNQFIELLRRAFTSEIPPFKDEWRDLKFDRYSSEENSFPAFEETILKQIVDLREIDETDLLSNEMRYLGLNSPRGRRWYNFDPLDYLECATAGFDAWQDEDNSTIDLEPQDCDHISWNQINDFLWCGQIYE